MREHSFNAPNVETLSDLIPGFEFISRLAADGVKAVYLASQKSLERKVAFKLYAPELAEVGDFRESFSAMARQTAKLNHVNLIGVYDSGEAAGMSYLVMEFVEGKPLWNSTKGKPVHMKHVRGLMSGICDGMEHAHKNGICHGNLCLSTILLGPDKKPKIGGFSHALAMGRENQEESDRFRAPEMAADDAVPTVSSDVYAMGAIARELLAGLDDGDQKASANLSRGEGARMLKVCEKAMSRDSAARHATAGEFKKDLLGRSQSAVSGAASKFKQAATQRLKKTGSPAAAGGRPAVAVPLGAASASGRLWRNLIIIAILSVAIFVAWSALQQEKQKRATLQSQMDQEKERKAAALRERMERDRIAAREDWQASQNDWLQQLDSEQQTEPESEPGPVTDPVAGPSESTMDALGRLREQLLAGDRSEMPGAARQVGGAYFCYVDQPMNWWAASEFAIEHGAHLAIPNADANAGWIRAELLQGAVGGYWVGLAASSRESWTRADGKPWRPTQPLQGEGRFVWVSPEDQLLAAEPSEQRPFLIQWPADGRNPGTLEALLDATRRTLTSSSPVYPPGTKAFGIRHYLYVPGEYEWKEAASLASLGGGHLLVANGIVEHFNLKKMVSALPAENGLWMGGCHTSGEGWQWITREPWKARAWPQDMTPSVANGALVVGGDGKWGVQARDEKASGFLIEWSQDAASASP